MHKNFIGNCKVNKEINSFNVIVADQDIETFEKLSKVKNDYNFINLSSDFAVNFVMEYEKIDVIIISKKISNLEKIKEKARRKKIGVYVIGEDMGFPFNENELEEILAREIKSKAERKKNRRKFDIKKYINNFFGRNLKKGKISKSKIVSTTAKADLNRSESTNQPGNLINKESKGTGGNCEVYSAEEYLCKMGVCESEYLPGCKYLENKTNGSNGKLKPEAVNCFGNGNVKTIKQKTIIFTKAKGGVGSTVLSIFLSCMFNKMKTLLIDLNFSEGGGDTGYYLGIPKTPNIMNFMDGYNRDSMDDSIFNIRDNLDILQSPPTYEQAKKVELQDIYSLVDVARKKYHLIIFDLPNYVNDFWLGVVDLADLLIMVSDHTLGSIGRLININNKFVYSDLEKILVVNKYDNSNGLSIGRDQMRKFFNLEKFVYLDEIELLRGRSDFSDFDFSSFNNFDNLTDTVFDLLTCD
jgi:MinD-like ATPase involved in chromosome partitioning or flagellar assembly